MPTLYPGLLVLRRGSPRSDRKWVPGTGAHPAGTVQGSTRRGRCVDAIRSLIGPCVIAAAGTIRSGRGHLQPIKGDVNHHCNMLPGAVLSEGKVAMNPDELAGAARNLAHALGIPVYIRDGRIYQHGPGREFLPPTSSRPTVADVSPDEDAFSTKTDQAE